MSPTSSAERPPAGPPLAEPPESAARLTRAVEPSPVTGLPGGVPVSPAIHAIELRKQYRRTVALEGLSLSVRRGEIFGFLGPNGAGKTTAVKLLLSLVRATSGEAMVLGAPVGDVETRRRIGYLPELFRFQSWLTAHEVLVLHCRLMSLPRGRWNPMAGAALATVGLSDRGHDRVGGFSKGMQQRLGLGVALLGEPELVVLDEPTSALDPVGRHQVREIIRDLRARGTTVFLNTHLLEEVEHVCDRVAVIDKGQTIAIGTLSELIGQQTSVRLRVSGLDERWWERIGDVGRWSIDGDWVLAEAIEPRQVPALVTAIVGLGGQVEAVIPQHKSLEDRFLELLSEE
jgi:ABC-2 type transport system ATP-binding protein